ncbi:3-isopropylmalate dehydratase small subunit [Acidithrix sp. C25]|uniref:3-isopropylmalate dehydratase small subunit n=1 Tax=Acidithrix sp. C25 TaxID=1671482 RepID=UPI00191BB1F7|nr:3-isopropylmalate dehydratase small subunit [Acidithrix sp. C25]
MKKINVFSGSALPLERSDVDTDQIIPSDWLKRVERTGFGAGLFGEWREDPTFILNDPRYANATILVAGPNFGTGSSREHAVWALTDYGFSAVISARFGDIFFNNSTKAGLVPVVLDAKTVATIQSAAVANPNLIIEVNIESREVSVDELGIKESFPLNDFTRYRFLEGLDDIGITLENEGRITTYENSRAAWLPRLV